MPIEPSTRINETQIIRREEGTATQEKKKRPSKKQAQPKEQERTGKIDIKI